MVNLDSNDPNNKITVGDIFKLYLGQEGSQSGPFYKVKVEGSGLAVENPNFYEPVVKKYDRIKDGLILGIRENGLIECNAPVSGILQAMNEGEAVITIMEKKEYSASTWTEEKKFYVTIAKR